MNNPVRLALLERRVTFGTWIQIGHPAISEVLANSGYEWIAVDCEHTDIGLETFSNLARGLNGRGPVPLARVRENDVLAIRQALDAGARGVIVPLVNTAKEAEKAVKASKFPPEGVRGFAFCRANKWGADFEAYVKDANSDTAVVVMIESRQAVENIDEILEVSGVDGVFIGPYDLSGSYGVVGETNHRLVEEALRTVSTACKKHGKSAGIHVVKPTEYSIKLALEEDFSFIALGMDTIFLDQASRDVLQKVGNILRG